MAIQTVTPGSSGLPVNAPLGTGSESGVNAYGGVGILKKTGLSSDIPVSTGSINIATAYGSDIFIEDILVETDATGIVGGTTFQIQKSDALGTKVFLSNAIAGVGPNSTRSFTGTNAWTTAISTVLPQNATLQIGSTGAPCTGAGVWNMWIRYRPMSASGSLA